MTQPFVWKNAQGLINIRRGTDIHTHTHTPARARARALRRERSDESNLRNKTPQSSRKEHVQRALSC